MLKNLAAKGGFRFSSACQKHSVLAKPKPPSTLSKYLSQTQTTQSANHGQKFPKSYVFGHNYCVTSPKNLSNQFLGVSITVARNFGKTHPQLQNINMPEIRFDEIKELLEEDKITFVDVREPAELTTDGKIPGSINIPLGELDAAFNLSSEKVEEKYGKPLPTSEEAEKLVLSCRSGRRAATAFDIVSKHGYQKARCYFGSYLDWVQKGGSIEK